LRLVLCAVAITVTFVGSVRLIMGQDTASEQKHLTVPTLNGRFPVRASALKIEPGVTYPSVVEMKGNVEIKTPVCLPVGKGGKLICDGEMIVRADEAKLHEDTGQIEATGSVVVTPLRHEPKR
jgi:hypothetical protein